MHVFASPRRRTAAVGIALAATVAASACGRGANDSGTAATVGGERISRDRVVEAVDRTMAVAPPGLTREQATQAYLTTQVQLKLHAEVAKKLGVAVGPAQVQESRDGLEERFAADGGLEKVAEGQGISASALAGTVELFTYQRLLAPALMQAAPEASDADLGKLAAQTPPPFGLKGSGKVAHILVADEALANSVLAEIKGGADFGALAAKHSQDPSNKDSGGDLGEFTSGQFVPPFEAAVFAAKAGDVIGPVKTTFGYHIIRVDQVTSVLSQLREGRTTEEVLAAVARVRLSDELRQAGVVEVNSRFGTWDTETNAVVAVDGEDDAPSAPLLSTTPTQ